MLLLNVGGLSLERVQLGLDGRQVALHARQATLEGHDASQVHLQTICALQDPLLVLDPRHRLTAFNVECLDSMGRAQLLTLGLCLLS